jgi:hypothetical protein
MGVDSGAGTGPQRVSGKQAGWAGQLCQGLRWADWDAVPGTRDEGDQGWVAGVRAREIFKCAGERDHEGVPRARGDILFRPGRGS